MTKLWVVVATFCAAAAIAQAAPAPTILSYEIEYDKIDRSALWRLPQSTVEPGGILIPKDPEAFWKSIGLEVGDIVRYQNGRAVGDRLRMSEGHHVLEVDRKGKVVLVSISVRGKSRKEVTLSDDEFTTLVERAKRSAAGDRLSVSLTHGGKPSAVRVIDMMLSLRTSIEVGDVVRTINGNAIRTDDDLTAALAGMRAGLNEIALERDGRPMTIAVTREAPLDLTRIRKLSDTSYQIPRTVRDAVKRDMWMLGKRHASVPATVGATVTGWKLLKIEPGSLLSAIGLRDEDILLDVEGRAINTNEEQINVHTDLENADSVTVHIERRGKKLAMVYKIEP
jgi:type II secretory pathway component PulC